MLDPSSPPAWLRPLSLRFVDLSREYLGASARRLRGGDDPGPRTLQWRRAWSDVVHSRRTLEGLKDAGVTAVALHCDEGFGRVAQADDLRHAAQFAAACRDLGLRVFARIEGAALYHEALLVDRPGLAAWAQRTPEGRIVPAGGGRPAWRPCYRSQGYLELLRDSVSVACERLQADGILLGPFGPQACHCERCQQGFRRWLTGRLQTPENSLGLSTWEHVRLPEADDDADPLSYEAAHFQVHALRSALAELRIHLRSISGHLALWAELDLGAAEGSRTAFGEVCAPLDVVTCASAPTEPDAWPAARAGCYLAGSASSTFVHLPACPGHPTDPSASLGAGVREPMTLGGHVLAHHGALRCEGCGGNDSPDALRLRFVADASLREAWRELLDFAARHEHYHHRAESLAEVALAFSEGDVAADPQQRREVLAAQQALLEAAIPFDVVPVTGAGRYAVTVLAGQARMTDEEARTASSLAAGGRGLLLAGAAGSCDEYGRRRAPAAFAADLARPGVRRVPSAGEQPEKPWRQHLAAVARELLPDPPVVHVTGPPQSLGRVWLRAFRLPTGQATFHLLARDAAPVEGLRLHVRADLAPSRHAAWHQPGASDSLLDCTVDGPTVVTALPPLAGYALVITS
ncbi:MAG: hypothetical protein FJX74_05625 [Armatimonadetes bacterium]|nr:hypothetical protein [Armatimonadota bacterium]